MLQRAVGSTLNAIENDRRREAGVYTPDSFGALFAIFATRRSLGDKLARGEQPRLDRGRIRLCLVSETPAWHAPQVSMGHDWTARQHGTA